jgi:hypothetical protein
MNTPRASRYATLYRFAAPAVSLDVSPNAALRTSVCRHVPTMPYFAVQTDVVQSAPWSRTGTQESTGRPCGTRAVSAGRKAKGAASRRPLVSSRGRALNPRPLGGLRTSPGPAETLDARDTLRHDWTYLRLSTFVQARLGFRRFGIVASPRDDTPLAGVLRPGAGACTRGLSAQVVIAVLGQ